MKLFDAYTATRALLLSGLIQLAHTQLERDINAIVEYYDTELNLLVREIALELKNISEEILNEQSVQEADAPMMKNFKINMIIFRQISPFYMGLGLNESLVIKFSDMNADYCNPTSSLSEDSSYPHIQQLLRDRGYDIIRDKYKTIFIKFIAQEFLAKFEKFKSKLLRKPHLTKLHMKFVRWGNKLLNCQEYECFLKSFKKATLTRKEHFVGFLQRNMLNLLIDYCNNATKFVNAVLEDPKMSQLSAEIREQFVKGLNYLINEYQAKGETFKHFFVLPSDMMVKAFLEQSFIPSLNDRKLIMRTLQEHGFGDVELLYKRTYHEYLIPEFWREFEKFKKSLNRATVRKEKTLLRALEALNNFTGFDDISKVFNILDNFDEKKLRKWRI